MLKAYNQTTGKEVKKGDIIKDFRGNKSTFIKATRERTFDKSGKILTNKGEYYDKGFDIIVKEIAE